MSKPDYLTPERAAELIPPNVVDSALLCPHCNHLLYVGEKLAGPGRLPRPKRARRKGASKATPPTAGPRPSPPPAEHYLDPAPKRSGTAGC